MEMEVSGYGGAILCLRVPDRQGRLGDVVLGFDRLQDYVEDSGYFGALIGRFANRIRDGRFRLDGREYALPVNDGGNHLHGGPQGFHKAASRVEPMQENGRRWACGCTTAVRTASRAIRATWTSP
jgi:aldose 1-epimerase